jgi:ATP-binding cassette subfamily F protein 3
MLAVDKVSVQFGARTLFRDLTFSVANKDRVSFAGPNGAGKSTLLKIIAGLNKPDSGQINKGKHMTIGYLPQEGVELKGRALFAEVETAFENVMEIQKKLDDVNTLLDGLDTSSSEYADALDIFGELTLHLEHHDISSMKPRIERVLIGLGFKKEDFDKPCEHFSGGWQMRIALSKLLLREPSVLLLDEPTNHLDIESQIWLEAYLQSYIGSIILVSHDRAFLDALINRTLAFEHGRVEEYSGNYTFYLTESVNRREQLKRAFINQQREIEKSQIFIDRFRSKASKASLVQSRIKMLAKIERIEMEPDDDANISFKFPEARRSGQVVAELIQGTKAYGEHVIFKDFDFQIQRGEKIAVVGVNGAGKSTFSSVLAAREPLTAGERKLGHHCELAHFAQNHAEELDPKMTVLETVETTSKGNAGNLRTILGCFLFRGDDVFKSVSVLSGGERSRLALARMLLRPTNFLILDEPTNHLDMRSQEMLQRALAAYEGAYMIVSHNRDFLDPITEKVLEFYPDDRPPKFYLGNVSQFLEKKREEAEASGKSVYSFGPPGQKSASKNAPQERVSGANRKEQRKKEAAERQQRADKLKPLKQKLEKAEADIAKYEQVKVTYEKKMADPNFFNDTAAATAATIEYQKSAKALENAYTDWSTISDELEKLEP